MEYDNLFKNWNFENVSKDINSYRAPNGINYIELVIKKGTLLWRTSSVEEDFQATRANPSWYSFDMVLSMSYGTSKYVTLYRVKKDIPKIIQWEYNYYTPGYNSDPSIYLYSFPNVEKPGRNIPMRRFSTTADQENVIKHIRNKDFNGWANFHSEEIILMDALDFLEPLHLWVRDKNFNMTGYRYPERVAMGLKSARKTWNPETDIPIINRAGNIVFNNYSSQTTSYSDEYKYRNDFYKSVGQSPSDPLIVNEIKDFDYYNSRRCLYALLRYYTRYDMVNPHIPHRSIRIDKTYMKNEIKYLEEYIYELDLRVTISEINAYDEETIINIFKSNLTSDPVLYVMYDKTFYYFVFQNKQLFHTPYEMPHLNYILNVKSSATLSFCEKELPTYNSNPIPALVYLTSLIEGSSNKEASSDSRKKSFRQAMRDIMDEYMISKKTFNISDYFNVTI